MAKIEWVLPIGLRLAERWDPLEKVGIPVDATRAVQTGIQSARIVKAS